MPRPPASDPDRWVLDVPPCPRCWVGGSSNERVEADGLCLSGRDNEDRWYTAAFQQVEVMLVLDGHDGARACELAQRRMPSVLLREVSACASLAAAMRSAFIETEKEFFVRIDSCIVRKMTLQDQIAKAKNSAEALRLFPNEVEEIQRLDSQIRGGSTAVLAVLEAGRVLRVANVGDSRALLCYLSEAGQLRTEQLSVDHTTGNEEELVRLAGLGLDRDGLRRSARLGMHQNTRSLGDYSIKGGYKDHDVISHASWQPGSAEPFIGPQRDVSHLQGFLVLMSDGLYNAFGSWSKRPASLNQDLAALIQRRLDRSSSSEQVAQVVVDEVKSLYIDTCRRGNEPGRLDDITLLIHDLNYPTGRASLQPALLLTSPPPAQGTNARSSSPLPPRATSPLPSTPAPSRLQSGGADAAGVRLPLRKAASDQKLARPHHEACDGGSREDLPVAGHNEDRTERSKPHYVNVSPRPHSDSTLEDKLQALHFDPVAPAPAPPPSEEEPSGDVPPQGSLLHKASSEEEEEDLYGPPASSTDHEDCAPTPVNNPERRLQDGVVEGGEGEESGTEVDSEEEELEVSADYFSEATDSGGGAGGGGGGGGGGGQMEDGMILPHVFFGDRFQDLSWEDL